MPSFAHIENHPDGPRVWLCGQRIHHGAVGALLAAACAATHRRSGVTLGTILMVHDAHDWQRWFAREELPSPSS